MLGVSLSFNVVSMKKFQMLFKQNVFSIPGAFSKRSLMFAVRAMVVSVGERHCSVAVSQVFVYETVLRQLFHSISLQTHAFKQHAGFGRYNP